MSVSRKGMLYVGIVGKFRVYAQYIMEQSSISSESLTVQLTFLLAIEKSNAATATILQFLSPTIIVAWFSLAKKKRSGKWVFAVIGTSLIGTFLLVTHGDPTSISISNSALFWGHCLGVCRRVLYRLSFGANC